MFPQLALAAFLGTAALGVQAPACLSQEEARESVQAEKLIELPEAARLAGQKHKGSVVSANLCRVNQRLVYVLAILSPEGRVARIAVDAKSRSVQDYR